jgi:hypothetical protein
MKRPRSYSNVVYDATTEGIDKATSEHHVDVVVCYSDSYFAGVSVASRKCFHSPTRSPVDELGQRLTSNCIRLSHGRSTIGVH